MGQEKRSASGIQAGSFVTALVVIAALMAASYGLTFLLPGCGLPMWKWLLSPVLVLGTESSGTILAVIVFLLVIGGIFRALESCNLMGYMLERIAGKFGQKKYTLLSVILFFFMAMGALIGSFEECVPLVPIVVALAVRLGWDGLTGMGISLLAVGCGFASGVFNPFTVGVAQGLAGLPMFSGAWLRAVSFVLIYILLHWFVRAHAKKVDRGADAPQGTAFAADRRMDRGLICFGGILGTGILLVLCSVFVPVLQDLSMIVVAVMFLAAGVTATLTVGMTPRQLLGDMGKGIVSMLPAVLMILMASSIRYTLEASGALGVILQAAIAAAGKLPAWTVILFIYAIVLGMNFFVASGSAKAFMLIPLIVPLAAVFQISPQLCILAFAFGDGFSNTVYPTNPVLLISLGLSDIGYGKWFGWTWKFQLMNLLLTSLILLLGLAVGY